MNEDRATRYQRLRRRASAGSTVLSGVLLAALTLSGASVLLRDAAQAVAGQSFFVAALIMVVTIAVLNELLLLPLAHFQGVTLERRYGLTTQSAAQWWLDHLKASGLALVAAVASGLVVSLLLRASPVWWWVCAALAFSAVLVVLTHVAPVLLLPMFDACEPLRRNGLESRLMALAERANTQVLGVFEWHLGARTKKANAALTGIGGTRRILVSDTLLADHSDDEIEVILAHELAHHVYHDIWTAIGVQACLLLVAAFVSDRVLSLSVEMLSFSGKSDLAALPLVALMFGAVSALLTPLTNAVSRAHERRADQYALEMTRNVTAFVSAMKRLGAQNLSDDRPSPLVEYLFHTHPSVGARISAAQAWAAGTGRAEGKRG